LDSYILGILRMKRSKILLLKILIIKFKGVIAD